MNSLKNIRERTSTTTANLCTPSPPGVIIPARGASMRGGRLSTTYQSRSSRTWAVWERPAPLIPVMMSIWARFTCGRVAASSSCGIPAGTVGVGSVMVPLYRLRLGYVRQRGKSGARRGVAVPAKVSPRRRRVLVFYGFGQFQPLGFELFLSKSLGLELLVQLSQTQIVRYISAFQLLVEPRDLRFDPLDFLFYPG